MSRNAISLLHIVACATVACGYYLLPPSPLDGYMVGAALLSWSYCAGALYDFSK